MPARSNAFQRLITFIETQLAPQGARVTESAMVEATDGSGPREVDVLIEGSIGAHPIRIGLECRDHGRPQTVAWIDQMIGTYDGLPIDKRIAVSRSGFSKLAIARAQAYGIATYTLKEAFAADWPENFTRWKAAVITWSFRLASASISYHGTDNPGLEGNDLLLATILDPVEASPSSFGKDVGRLFAQHRAQTVNKAIKENYAEWWKEGPGREFDIHATFPANKDRVLVTSDGKTFPIKSVTLDIRCSYTDFVASRWSGVR